MKIKDKKFWAKVQRNNNRNVCWYWLGAKDDDGYGRVARKAVKATPVRVHRYAFFLHHGRWPEGDCHHGCGNKLCVRPSHLFDNLMLPTSGKSDHEMYSIADDVRKRYAKSSRVNGVSALAREYGVSQKFIRRIIG